MYAPMVQWSTVQLMLIMTCILKLHTVSIDFYNAFAQADMSKDSNNYIECPCPRKFAQLNGPSDISKE